MGDKSVVVLLSTEKPAKLIKWKVKEGTNVSVGRVILLYDDAISGSDETKKFKAIQVGTVSKLLAKEGDIIQPGCPVLELEECTHPTVMRDMCAECGADLRKAEDKLQNASVPMIHSIPELKVSVEQAHTLGKADEARLLKHRKLVLLVDLDQTLIHTTNDNIPANLKDVYHFQLHGAVSPWYHTRLRPGTHTFLKNISDLYELHICTFGARSYAHTIAMFLDHEGKYFSHRILSRDECFNATSKTANLKALFPCGDHMVCIIDDREDVWTYAPNLIHVRPYHFFQHTGDINAPPGLAKQENDEKEGYDFSSIDPKTKAEDKDDKTENSQNGDSSEKDNVAHMAKLSMEKKSKAKESGSEKEEGELNEDSVSCDGDEPAAPSQDKEIAAVKSDLRLTDDESQDTSINNSKEASQDDEQRNEDTDGMQADFEVSDDDEQKKAEKPVNNESVEPKDGPGENKSECIKTETSEEPMEVSAADTKEEEKETKNSYVSRDRQSGEGEGEEELIEIEDHDDYLLYLEEILKIIHKAFYNIYDQLKEEGKCEVPDLKNVIPYVRRKVLEGVNIVFSGVVPTCIPLEKSRPYTVAKSLGAKITEKVIPRKMDKDEGTTHLVAARLGTAKVNEARKVGGVFIVTPDWLWCCAERWERVDERLFPLNRNTAVNRKPPSHCGSPDINQDRQQQGTECDRMFSSDLRVTNSEVFPTYDPVTGKRIVPSASSGDVKKSSDTDKSKDNDGSEDGSSSDRFMDTINPLLSFSSEDIANMDKEVEDIFNESDESESEDEPKQKPTKIVLPPKVLQQVEEEEEESSSSSADSLSGDHPKGWGKESQKRKRDADLLTGTGTGTETEEDMPSAKFRRGEALPSDLDLGEQESFDSDENNPDEMDDREWNMMGAALEREFLAGSNE